MMSNPVGLFRHCAAITCPFLQPQNVHHFTTPYQLYIPLAHTTQPTSPIHSFPWVHLSSFTWLCQKLTSLHIKDHRDWVVSLSTMAWVYLWPHLRWHITHLRQGEVSARGFWVMFSGLCHIPPRSEAWSLKVHEHSWILEKLQSPQLWKMEEWKLWWECSCGHAKVGKVGIFPVVWWLVNWWCSYSPSPTPNLWYRKSEKCLIRVIRLAITRCIIRHYKNQVILIRQTYLIRIPFL